MPRRYPVALFSVQPVLPMVHEGDHAPDFSLPDQDGRAVSLKDLRGRKVVLYFYPKDDTPGCTREACGFRDNLARVQAKGAVVLGVSRDSEESHVKFRGKYDIPYPLLSDSDRAVHELYGVWGKKTLYGKETEGVIRSTFLIDERGKVRRIFSPVKVDGHVDEVLAAL